VIVYCDTSFLVSLLNEEDVNHAVARRRAAELDRQDFVVCEVHLIELPAAVRAATHRPSGAIPPHIARRVINRFDRAVTSRLFQRKSLDLPEAIGMTRSLGEAHGWAERHTGFDLWHLGAAWSLSAGVFLTFDERQKGIARLMGMA
jgi:predicted nucleic acid-binding protein